MKNNLKKCLKKCLYFSFCILSILGIFYIKMPIVYAAVILGEGNARTVTGEISTEHVVWNKVPINFVVSVGAERMISFPGSISLHNMDPSLTTDKISILNNAGTLYIKAKKSFSPIRIPIVLKSSGEVMLLDLSAENNADDLPVQVLLDKELTNKSVDNGCASKSNTLVAPTSYVGLMRYALQHLYSPERLVEDSITINRTPMYTTKSVALVYGEKVLAMPLISWRGGDLYVTAILLKNMLKHRVSLSVANLKGKWLAATFYPTNYIEAKGKVHDQTTLFLISDRPFNEALNSMRGYR